MLLPRSVLLVLAVVPLLVGCDPKPAIGEICRTGSLPACSGPNEMLACVHDRWVAVPCRGAKGCAATPASCDGSVGRAGDICLQAAYGRSETCSEDHVQVLSCEESKLEPARACRGPKKCANEAGLACDETLGTVGEPCSRLESRPFSCAVDGKALLACESPPSGTRLRGGADGVLIQSRECPTVAGCKQGDSWAYCDFTGSPAGTPCGKGNENREFCSPDRKAVLKCDPTSLTLREDRKCGASECTSTDRDGRASGGCER